MSGVITILKTWLEITHTYMNYLLSLFHNSYYQK